MRRKKNLKVPSTVTKFFIIGISILLVGVLLYQGVIYFATRSHYFKVKVVRIDPSIEFIRSRDLEQLKGESIFTIDLEKLHKKLGYQHPEVSQLKILKRYPDQIWIQAQKRLPFAQTQIRNRTLTLDEEGIVLSMAGALDHNLPFIIAVNSDHATLGLGLPLGDKSIQIALRVVKTFQASETLGSYMISRINVKNLSEISFYLNDNFKVIIDHDRIEDEIKVLSLFLSQNELDLEQMRYVDLRFNEPVVGKK